MAFNKEILARLRKEAAAPGGTPRRRRRKGRAALIVLAAAVAGWFIMRGDRGLEVDTVMVESPAAGTGGVVLNASGYVVARRLATVSSKVTGRVAAVLFEEGAAVQEGQVLARLDDTTVRAQYDVALRQRDAARQALAEVEVRLAEARRNLARARQLRPQNLVSQSALEAAEADEGALAARLETARADVAVADSSVRLRGRDLEDLVVRAPFAGVVISKDAQPGEMVSPISAGGGYTRTGIATVVDMDSREIEVDVNESYINRVAAGQRTEAVLDAYSDWTIPARVIAIVPAADRQKATVRVRIGFEQLDPRILPDMGVKVKFFDESAVEAAGRAVASVPGNAIDEQDGRLYAWRVTDGRVQRVPVEAGAEGQGRRDVLAGLAPGEAVVVGRPAGLVDGARVRPRQAQ